jgi:2-keto-4-pentenoate hydratase
MEEQRVDEAARLLASVRRGSATRPNALPEHLRPSSIAQAHAVQDRTVDILGESVAGWKTAVAPTGVSRGAILGPRVFESPASMAGAGLPLLGVEAEIAFWFVRELPPSPVDYTTEEVAAAVEALVGIEVVGTRFRSYDDAPALDRIADCMANEAFVIGTRRPDWRSADLASLEATLRVNGDVVVRQAGGHVTKDPLIPAVALVNLLRHSVGIHSGQFITTGTFTGLHRCRPGDHVEVAFERFGEAALTFRDEPALP